MPKKSEEAGQSGEVEQKEEETGTEEEAEGGEEADGEEEKPKKAKKTKPKEEPVEPAVTVATRGKFTLLSDMTVVNAAGQVVGRVKDETEGMKLLADLAR